MGKLNLNFSYTFNGKIWNIISHAEKELLLLEVREDEKFLATYSLLDTVTGQFLIKNMDFEEKWWIGVSHLVDNVILFHTYPDQDNPDNRDLFAYHFLEQRILWKKEGKSIAEVVNDTVVLMKYDGAQPEYFDVCTGKLLEDEFKIKKRNVKNKLLEKPFHYREGNEYFNTVSRFLAANANINIVKGVDYYENDHFMVMSYYYTNKNNNLANDLLVVDHNGEFLMNDQLGNDLKGISDDTFFIYNNKLIFVKGNTDFLVYQLAYE